MLFNAALAQSPTEFNSLKRLIPLNLAGGDVSAAMAKIGVLLTRWPGEFTELAAIFAPLLQTEPGYAAVLAAVRQGAVWRKPLLYHLASDPLTGGLAYRLLLDLRGAVPPVPQAEVDRVVGLIFGKGQPQLAYLAFALTTAPERLQDLGYVTNSGFAATAASSPFDWHLSRLAGVETEMTGAAAGGLSVVFRQRPVKGTNRRADAHAAGRRSRTCRGKHGAEPRNAEGPVVDAHLQRRARTACRTRGGAGGLRPPIDIRHLQRSR